MTINDLTCDENVTILDKVNAELSVLRTALNYASGEEKDQILDKIDSLETERIRLKNKNKRKFVHMNAEDLDDDLVDMQDSKKSIDDIEVCDGRDEMRKLTDEYITNIQNIMYNYMPEKIVPVGFSMEYIIRYLQAYERIIYTLKHAANEDRNWIAKEANAILNSLQKEASAILEFLQINKPEGN